MRFKEIDLFLFEGISEEDRQVFRVFRNLKIPGLIPIYSKLSTEEKAAIPISSMDPQKIEAALAPYVVAAQAEQREKLQKAKDDAAAAEETRKARLKLNATNSLQSRVPLGSVASHPSQNWQNTDKIRSKYGSAKTDGNEFYKELFGKITNPSSGIIDYHSGEIKNLNILLAKLGVTDQDTKDKISGVADRFAEKTYEQIQSLLPEKTSDTRYNLSIDELFRFLTDFRRTPREIQYLKQSSQDPTTKERIKDIFTNGIGLVNRIINSPYNKKGGPEYYSSTDDLSQSEIYEKANVTSLLKLFEYYRQLREKIRKSGVPTKDPNNKENSKISGLSVIYPRRGQSYPYDENDTERTVIVSPRTKEGSIGWGKGRAVNVCTTGGKDNAFEAYTNGGMTTKTVDGKTIKLENIAGGRILYIQKESSNYFISFSNCEFTKTGSHTLTGQELIGILKLIKKEAPAYYNIGMEIIKSSDLLKKRFASLLKPGKALADYKKYVESQPRSERAIPGNIINQMLSRDPSTREEYFKFLKDPKSGIVGEIILPGNVGAVKQTGENVPKATYLVMTDEERNTITGTAKELYSGQEEKDKEKLKTRKKVDRRMPVPRVKKYVTGPNGERSEELLEFNERLVTDSLKNKIINAAKAQRMPFGVIGHNGVYEVEPIISLLRGLDPTHGKKNVLWLIQRFADGQINYSDLSEHGDLAEPLKKFEELKTRKILTGEKANIYSYRSVEELKATVDNLADKIKPVDRVRNRGKYEEIINTDRVRVIVPKTEAASKYYGRGTKWCTSANNNNEFDEYKDDGIILFIIIPKKPSHEGEKYQLSLSTRESSKKNEIRNEWNEDLITKSWEDDYAPNYSKIKKLSKRMPEIHKLIKDLAEKSDFWQDVYINI